MRKVLIMIGILMSIFLSGYAPGPIEVTYRGTQNGIITLNESIKDELKRGEAAGFFIKILRHFKDSNEIEQKLKKNENFCGFSDIDLSTPNFQNMTESCKLGIFNGINNTFEPNEILTPAQAFVILMRMMVGNLPEQNALPRWNNYADIALKYSIIKTEDIGYLTLNTSITKLKILEWVYSIEKNNNLKSEPMFMSFFQKSEVEKVLQTDLLSGIIHNIPLQSQTQNNTGTLLIVNRWAKKLGIPTEHSQWPGIVFLLTIRLICRGIFTIYSEIKSSKKIKSDEVKVGKFGN